MWNEDLGNPIISESKPKDERLPIKHALMYTASASLWWVVGGYSLVGRVLFACALYDGANLENFWETLGDLFPTINGEWDDE